MWCFNIHRRWFYFVAILCKDIEKQEVLFRAGKAKKTCQSVYPAAFPDQCTGLYFQLYPIPSDPTKQMKRPSYFTQATGNFFTKKLLSPPLSLHLKPLLK